MIKYLCVLSLVKLYNSMSHCNRTTPETMFCCIQDTVIVNITEMSAGQTCCHRSDFCPQRRVTGKGSTPSTPVFILALISVQLRAFHVQNFLAYRASEG